MASVAENIRQHREEIIHGWSEQAARAASARGLDGPEFKNVMPSYLASLAEEEGRPGANANARKAHIQSHVATRLRQGFNVAEVIEEFAILGRCVTHTWANAPPRDRPSPQDVERLFAELHDASVTVAERFSQHLLEDEQTEKRYVRLLQKEASQALLEDTTSLHPPLKGALELIVEAMGAQSAAVLLYEVEGERLVTAAASGLASEQLERYATSMSPSSFPGKIAAGSDETCSVLDAGATPFELSPQLRQSGLRSLLGVRLPPHRALVGVMFVGLTEVREFSPREKARLISLGQQLSVHLDNAKLYAKLREKIEALQVERGLRERFVSVLAHDLRGPLSSAKSGAHLLLRHPERLDQRRDLALRIERSIERTDQMVRDLLDANRLQAGQRLPLRLDTCDLDGIAREVVEELSAIHGDRFVLHAEEWVRGVWSAEELRRALWNLGSNAIKYGSATEPITFTVTRTGDTARAAVHNRGPVIPLADQEQIFKPFTRTHSAQEGPSKGWGLGLTLVWGCAQAHGGSVAVQSDAATGTTFTLTLPLDARPYQPREP
ncbi:histidine kinase [Corallococcus sp. AB049A]|uniref:histidine kinase n=1 Tax=Corallococcus interemptor TaxID=2316720 RepID=A0A3A8QT89_9BACT|nr:MULTISPECIES: HAMP domain-containing sensor histidine kinase [Corallococcus]RKH52963.1 histidine kinase [Corallococcus sp. AB050B]RKH72019.1 histidine kinase [Corallococcus interemptor]RKI74244.1 histidine kinase [Corallococcus sp. AB049A]